MKIIILGKGYVGNNLYNHLIENLSSHYGPTATTPTVDIFSKSELDYTDEWELSNEINSTEQTYIVNCSGFTGRPNVDEAENRKEDCWKYNVQVPLLLNKVCKEAGAEIIHITSGCIFTGYEKEWDESDVPNYGMYSNVSSFYSKSKHAFESISDHGLHLRIRMPFCNTLHERSFLTKIYNYDSLVDSLNSKTYIPDLCAFIEHYIASGYSGRETIHFANKEPLSTKEVVDEMRSVGLVNENWSWVDWEGLDLKANRSNCILDITKLEQQYNWEMGRELDALKAALENITRINRIAYV